MKKLISIIMCTVMLLSVLVPAIGAYACECESLPLIYVKGQSTIYKNGSTPPYESALSYSSSMVTDAAKTLVPSLANAVFLGKWDEFCDEIYNVAAPIFESYTLSAQGTVTDNSGIAYPWSPEKIGDTHLSGNIYSYLYEYDARLDPCEIADDLNEFIENVKRVTGHDRVNIVSRCMGTNMLLAYLAEYCEANNYESINSCVFYNGALNGTVVCGKLYSAELEIDADGLDRYLIDMLGDDLLDTLIKTAVSYFCDIYVLDMGTELINYVYGRVYDDIVPRLMRSSFATVPGFWSMVDDKYYDEAKKIAFEGYEQEYAVLIEKIDNYHYNILNRREKIITDMSDAGVNIAFICKYGNQLLPVVGEADSQSDGMILLQDQSFGATCSPVNESFSSEYLRSAVKNGTAEYISADCQVDASTCLFPDSTWFIKDLDHDPFPDCVNPLIWEICRNDGQVSIEDTSYPQYLLYTGSDIVPLEGDGANTQNRWYHNLYSSFTAFIKALFAYLKDYIQRLQQPTE